jgi:uncharacterized protein (TIGR00255 family)
MILSMTGYGTASVQRDDTVVSIEVRTVNHRFLDIHTRLAREFAPLEADVQQLVRAALTRGRVDVSVSIQTSAPVEVSLNLTAVKGYLQAAEKLKSDFQLSDTLDIRTVMTLPGVLQNREAIVPELSGSIVPDMVKQSMLEALDSVARMRAQEGAALQADMLQHIAAIRQGALNIRGLGPATVAELRRKLEERLAQLHPSGVDPQRLAQEVAILADKCDISEEIARLQSHLDQYVSLMDSGGGVGKKLDFLLQEMQREINTVLSKAANLEITRCGIAVKADIEKLREQVQNVE